MKAIARWIGIVALSYSANAEDVADPQSHVVNRRYEAGDVIKRMTFDVNSDGVPDSFFTTIEGNPGPAIRISNEQAGGSMSWDVYVSNQGAATFKVNTSVEIGGEINQGAGLDLNTDKMYFGNISEISRFGIVTSAVKRSKSENFTVIYAYTWEGDYFKQWKMAEYVAGEQNAIFDKYLKEDKRTHVTLQQVKP
jgi:hypothetical protein